MVDNSIDNNLYLARICHLSGLSEETLKYIEEVIKLKNGDLTDEERNLLFSSLKKLINFRRESWRTVNALESKEIKNQSSLLPRVTQLKQSLVEEIKQYVNKGIELIDNYLFKSAKTDELKLIYSKTKGDYIRYIIELTPKEKEEEINLLKEQADDNYRIALSKCYVLSDLNTNKIGLFLNYTVFLYEIMKDYKNAYIIANNAYEKTMKTINDENIDITLQKDLNNLINLIKDNVTKWSENLIQDNFENLSNELSPINPKPST